MSPTRTRALELTLGAWVRARLPHLAAEMVMFVLKQGWACLFGMLLLTAILISRAFWQSDWPIARYDALFLFAIAVQVAFLTLRLETPAEARVIALFHITGTAMEIFKIHAGSWAYPEPGIFKLAGVPLFSGFMYASVGSYMARVIRIFEMRFTPFPPYPLTLALAALIYVNFFSHHFLPDIRIALFAATVILYARTQIHFSVGGNYRMPLPLAALLSSFFLWLAENSGTLTGTWIYAGQNGLELVSFAKLGSWYLLLYVAFATVTLVSREALGPRK
jgi:uncharacterized membrane protein YoaT (DUF817 family)